MNSNLLENEKATTETKQLSTDSGMSDNKSYFKVEDVKNTPFKISSEKDGTFRIVMGGHYASEMKFKRKWKAKRYIRRKNWELIYNGVIIYNIMLDEMKLLTKKNN